MDVIDYKIIASGSPATVAAEVKQALAEGWELFEGLALAHSGTQRYYAQAMVKYADEP